MKIPTIEKFLCCIKLEIGALIIGWIGLLWSSVMLFFLTVLFTGALFSYAKLLELLPKDSYFYDLTHAYSPILVKFIILLTITYFGVYFYCSKRLVGSLKTREPTDTVPYIILTVVDLIFSVLSILHLSWIAIVQALVRIVYYGYILLTVFSVKEFLHEENRSGRHRNSQYQSAPLTMYKF